ncbi:nuclease A inhibitor family protein [Deinococcus sp. QL22]|uniref:nuclease A inhibitor family protein n=1 Tax=Deinococcus sp. QL22 TaxID=2939437 RepID=UPI002017E761|nr:nuclease A inhibitor family protein [Deinococcus sp. QL22]UQN10686.1 nuclease A inhibitor family protein [Deinococcus sp. QL22]
MTDNGGAMLKLLLALTLALSACATPPRPKVSALTHLAAQALRDCPVPMTVKALARISTGLLYLSETDAPFSPVWSPAQRLPPAESVVQFVMLDAAAVEVREFEAFFERLTTPTDPLDPASAQSARRFRLLRDTFRRSYSAMQVYRVQERDNPAVWRIFILGEDRGGVSGLETWAVET